VNGEPSGKGVLFRDFQPDSIGVWPSPDPEFRFADFDPASTEEWVDNSEAEEAEYQALLLERKEEARA